MYSDILSDIFWKYHPTLKTLIQMICHWKSYGAKWNNISHFSIQLFKIEFFENRERKKKRRGGTRFCWKHCCFPGGGAVPYLVSDKANQFRKGKDVCHHGNCPNHFPTITHSVTTKSIASCSVQWVSCQNSYPFASHILNRNRTNSQTYLSLAKI